MKKLASLLFFFLLLLSEVPLFAQTEKISFSSEELLDRVCRIYSSTVVNENRLLAVIPCFMDEDNQAGFYYKDRDKWTLIQSVSQRDCYPSDVAVYEEAVNFHNYNVDQSFKGKYPFARLLVLEYIDSTCKRYDIFDTELKKVISDGNL